ncbi:MAG: capsule biosynthesis protein, partial [Rhodobacteraceae bacterium]|nr:capsule biosynthesis protein [Paracoccaceae bacterium]
AARIEAIRNEGLTGRQLRMARRLAQKHGLPATSDHDAVRLLRDAGIDPFERGAMLELVVGRPPEQAGDARAQLPQTVRPGATAVGAPAAPSPSDFGEREVMEIQRDIARRRRRRSLLLAVRLFFFVVLPTLIAGYYYYAVATPMYSTKSDFVIQQADPPAASGMGGLLSGTSFATSQDAITVQSYLQSRDAMLRLDADLGFKAHFADPAIDPIQRLAPDATNEDAYRLYKRMVKIGYDPTEGLVRMEVIAADPDKAAAFSRALIGYAEEQVDQLTQRLRGDQMEEARRNYLDAEAEMLTSQRKVVGLQEQFNVLSSEAEAGLLTSQIGRLETQLLQERLALEELLANAVPNQARIDPIRARMATIEDQIASLRARLTQGGDGSMSLARIQGELVVAQAEVQTRQMLLAQSLQALETARIEANRQVRYLSLGVPPVVADAPSYPRAFENTLLAALIFAGIYLMLSMTAAILREQVSA